MHIVTGVIRCALALLAFSFAANGLSDYFGGNEADVAKFEQLAAEGETAIGLLDSVYTEQAWGPTSIYNIDYRYTVGGKDYTGNMDIDDPDALASPFVEITYLPSDPAVSSDDAPAALMEAQQSSNSKTDLWLGIGAIVFGGLLLWSGIAAFRGDEDA